MATKAAEKNKIVVAMSYAKETKNTFVFKSDDEDAVVKAVYVDRSAYPKGAPAHIELTVSV